MPSSVVTMSMLRDQSHCKVKNVSFISQFLSRTNTKWKSLTFFYLPSNTLIRALTKSKEKINSSLPSPVGSSFTHAKADALVRSCLWTPHEKFSFKHSSSGCQKLVDRKMKISKLIGRCLGFCPCEIAAVFDGRIRTGSTTVKLPQIATHALYLFVVLRVHRLPSLLFRVMTETHVSN